MPVFGSILAVLFLGETFYVYHAIGIATIGAGILLASIKSAPAIRPALDPNRT
jgi:drug/metabolite transporter (DMT)-like permease